MKQIKIFLLAILLAMPGIVLAQSENTHEWKGFFEFFCGFSTGHDNDIPPYGYKLEPKVSFGINFTEGYQITDYLFAGVGFGAYTLGVYDEDYSYGFDGVYGDEYIYKESRTFFPGIYAPVFADVRWTLDINRTINPFVDLKLGYQFAIPIQDECIGFYDNLYVRPKGGFYCLPSVGVRLGKRSGFNLGVGYNVSTRRHYYTVNTDPQGEVYKTYYKPKSTGSFVITIGADF